MLEERLVGIQDKAKFILENYPETRNSRKVFASTYMQHFKVFSIKEMGEALEEIETAKRAQRRIQNTWKMYQPTEQVQEQREEASESHAFVFGE